MQKKIFIRLSLLAIIILAFVFALRPSTTTTISGKNTSCKESIEDCSKKSGPGSSENMLWELVLSQFVTSTGLSY